MFILHEIGYGYIHFDSEYLFKNGHLIAGDRYKIQIDSSSHESRKDYHLFLYAYDEMITLDNHEEVDEGNQGDEINNNSGDWFIGGN